MAFRIGRGLCALAAAAMVAAVLPPASADNIQAMEHPLRTPEFKFPSLGPGIEPGASWTYGFALRNRYNASMENLSLTVEIYKWATVEQIADASSVKHVPLFADTAALSTRIAVPTLPANATYNVTARVRTDPGSPEGVYFVRHLIEFDYLNFTIPFNTTPRAAHFVLKSRGYFTAEQYASLNYSDLENSLAALSVQGIVPDGSFSVKRPIPLWPLAIVLGATVVTGGLSTSLYLTDTYPGRFPRLKGFLLRLAGKAAVWRATVGEALRERLGRGGPSH